MYSHSNIQHREQTKFNAGLNNAITSVCICLREREGDGGMFANLSVAIAIYAQLCSWLLNLLSFRHFAGGNQCEIYNRLNQEF